MSIETVIPPELLHELEKALDRAAQGIRDPQEMSKALSEMDRMREDLRQRIGTVDLAVDLIRDARNLSS